MNARIPTPEVEDSDFGAFEAAQAVMERPVDKEFTATYYAGLAARAGQAKPQRGPQHQIQIRPGDAIVGVPYRGEVFDVACEVEPPEHRHQRSTYTIFALKLNGVWFGGDWAPCLTAALQRVLDSMPRNDR